MHHELAKYHEIGRFALDGDENKIDWSSALFHEEHAAELGISEAIVTMAKIYLNLPHDVLVSCEVPVCVQLVLSYIQSVAPISHLQIWFIKPFLYLQRKT